MSLPQPVPLTQDKKPKTHPGETDLIRRLASIVKKLGSLLKALFTE